MLARRKSECCGSSLLGFCGIAEERFSESRFGFIARGYLFFAPSIGRGDCAAGKLPSASKPPEIRRSIGLEVLQYVFDPSLAHRPSHLLPHSRRVVLQEG